MTKVTIVSPDHIYPDKKLVDIGTKIVFQKDYASEYPNAIKALIKDGAQVGNVANSSHTTQKGTKSSSEIFDIMPDEFEGEVVQQVEIKFNNGTNSTGFIVEIHDTKKSTKETKGGKTTMNKKVLKVLVEGPKKFHPHKYLPVPDLKEGKIVPVTLKIVSNQVLVMYDNAGVIDSCGNVQDKMTSPEKDFLVSSDLLTAMEKYKGADGTVEYEAKLTGFEESIKYVLEVEFKGETAIEAVLNTVVNSGIMSDEELKKRLEWTGKLSLNEKNIIAIFGGMKKHSDLSRIPQGDFKFINSNSIAELAIASYNAGLNILLEGPKASGKNTLIEDIGRLYNVPVYEIQINAQTDNETLLGSKTLKAKDSAMNKEEINKCIQLLFGANLGTEVMNRIKSVLTSETSSAEEKVDEVKLAELLMKQDFTPLVDALRSGQAEVEFQPSVMIKAMEEGGIIVFDEINTGHPSVLALLNSILDNRRRIQVPSYGLVKAHPNFRAFATMNKDYQGTFELNEATASRFTPIVFEEPASIKEILKKNVPGVNKQTLTHCDKLYEAIRKQTRDGKMQSQAINIRAFINACIQEEWNIPLKVALINNVANSCPDLDDRATIKQTIDLMIKES